ncbi:hypothetical protein CLOSYM_01767 [[Clostridium] symbiosum ATCC 14940]|uniref:Uncharacterized protein n=1 Tax=[Clostridium] symbiosum ATCC 14940 TaxID=411472 RepID=A0ABC9TZD4_CLOSY|nr:hypothetical protein CLOSYM_01767 [[Clostridium] symbiosum ATCC 14940]
MLQNWIIPVLQHPLSVLLFPYKKQECRKSSDIMNCYGISLLKAVTCARSVQVIV